MDQDIEKKCIDEFQRNSSLIAGSKITITVVNGTVFLEGFVGEPSKKIISEMLCYEINGVKKVINELLIVPSGHISDFYIAMEIQKNFQKNRELREAQIDISVTDGKVTLKGNVYTLANYKEAQHIVSLIVKNIENRLIITPE